MACGALRRDKGNGKPLPTSSVPSSSEGDWGGWGGAGDDDPDIDWVDVSRVRRNGSRESRARRRRAAPPSALACFPHASPPDVQTTPSQPGRAPRINAQKPARTHVSRRHSRAARLLRSNAAAAAEALRFCWREVQRRNRLKAAVLPGRAGKEAGQPARDEFLRPMVDTTGIRYRIGLSEEEVTADIREEFEENQQESWAALRFGGEHRMHALIRCPSSGCVSQDVCMRSL